MSSPAIIVLSPDGMALAARIAEVIGGTVETQPARIGDAELPAGYLKNQIRKLFAEGRPIVGIMAAGALIRLLAPVLSDKASEPPVLAVASDGSCVVPLTGGHHGANDLARAIAEAIGGIAAVTTSGDLKFGIALDQPPAGYRLANRTAAKGVMASLLAGGNAKLVGEAAWLSGSRITFSENGNIVLRVTDRQVEPEPLGLVYHPATLVLGMGCERGVEGTELIGLAERLLAENNFAPQSLACIASIDLKADETALHQAGAHFNVPVRFFDAPTLEALTPKLATPSDVVFAETGCHGVAEGAALAAAGDGSCLAVAKQKSKRATAALARSIQPICDLPGRAQGQLFVVGIGPGNAAWRSPEVSAMIASATDLVGYSLYLDLVGEISAGKVRHDFGLGAEEERVRHAMELAGKGRKVALISSGDAGIYAMATLVFELLEKGGLSDAAKRIAIEVSPGISALQAAAARAGAPLGHDFCTISLSDLLTPWEDIMRRVKAAAEGDFVIAFYNPVSRRRRTQLAWSRQMLLQHRPVDTPVILATNLGRRGEKVRFVTLGALSVDDVDMLTVVLVGSSQSRLIATGNGRNWMYTPRGYAARDGAGIAPAVSERRDLAR